MRRLNPNNINIPELSNDIFQNRWHGQVHYIDWERFKSLAKHYKGGAYLDLGCFNSPMPGELKRNYPESEIVGIDHADKVIARMREIFPEVRYIKKDFTTIPFHDGYFDYIVAGEVIEHLEHPDRFIQEGMRVLKKGGWFAISTPFDEKNRSNPEHTWGYTKEDIKELFDPYGDAEIDDVLGDYPVLMAWCKKR